MSIPPPLKKGDRVAVVAPASPVSRESIEPGVEILASWGLAVEVPEETFEKTGYLAGPDEMRAETLNRLFRDPEIRAVFAARGGYGTLRILESIDFAALEASPKLLVGFSDITGLLLAALKKASIASIHGPTVNTMKECPEEELDLLRNMAMGRSVAIEARGLSMLRDGDAQGGLLGGNLTTLVHLLETPFEPEYSGSILFVEDRGEAAYRLDRLMSHLKAAGRLDGIAGLVLGEFFDCGPREHIEEMVLEVTGGLGFPVASGLAVGHGRRNLPLWMGGRAGLSRGVLKVEI